MNEEQAVRDAILSAMKKAGVPGLMRATVFAHLKLPRTHPAVITFKNIKCFDPELHECRPCDCDQLKDPCGECHLCVNGHQACLSPISSKKAAK